MSYAVVGELEYEQQSSRVFRQIFCPEPGIVRWNGNRRGRRRRLSGPELRMVANVDLRTAHMGLRLVVRSCPCGQQKNLPRLYDRLHSHSCLVDDIFVLHSLRLELLLGFRIRMLGERRRYSLCY